MIGKFNLQAFFLNGKSKAINFAMLALVVMSVFGSYVPGASDYSTLIDDASEVESEMDSQVDEGTYEDVDSDIKSEIISETSNKATKTVYSISGADDVIVKKGSSFSMFAGVKINNTPWNDVSEDVISHSTSGSVNTNVVGNYKITYKAGNTEVVRNVYVVEPAVDAELNQVSTNDNILQLFGLSSDIATVLDIKLNKVAIDNSIEELGEYKVTLRLRSSRYEEIVTLNVIENEVELDEVAPVINIANDLNIDFGTDINSVDFMSGVTATDNIDLDITDKVEIIGKDSIDTKKSGNYEVTYRVSDSSNNLTEVNRNVIVKPKEISDTEKPVIHTSDITVKYGANFDVSEDGVTVTDNVDNDIKVTVTGSVNTKVTGNKESKIYTVTYNAEDKAKNKAIPVTRKITVLHYADHTNSDGVKYRDYYSGSTRYARRYYHSNGKSKQLNFYNESSGTIEKATYYNTAGTKTIYKTYYANGRIHTRTTYRSNKSRATYYERYNASSGQYKKYYNYYSNGKVSKRQLWSSNGNLTDTHEYHSNGKVKVNYDYYDNGTISKRYTYNSSGKRTTYYTRYRGTRYSNGSHKSGGYKDYRSYYSNGKYHTRKLYASDGDYTDYKEYYSNGQIKTNYDYYSNGTISKRYTYNSKGHRTTYYIRYQGTKSSSGAHHSGQYKEYRNYDGHGHLTKLQTWSSNGHRNDYKEYYSNGKKSKDYSYYSNGKVNTRILYYSNGKYKEKKYYYSNGKTKQIIKYNSKGKVTSNKKYSSGSSSSNNSKYPTGSVGAGVDACKKIINDDYKKHGWIIDNSGQANGNPSIWGDNVSGYTSCHIRGIYSSNGGHGRAYVKDNGNGTYDIGWQQVKI